MGEETERDALVLVPEGTHQKPALPAQIHGAFEELADGRGRIVRIIVIEFAALDVRNFEAGVWPVLHDLNGPSVLHRQAGAQRLMALDQLRHRPTGKAEIGRQTERDKHRIGERNGRGEIVHPPQQLRAGRQRIGRNVFQPKNFPGALVGLGAGIHQPWRCGIAFGKGPVRHRPAY